MAGCDGAVDAKEGATAPFVQTFSICGSFMDPFVCVPTVAVAISAMFDPKPYFLHTQCICTQTHTYVCLDMCDFFKPCSLTRRHVALQAWPWMIRLCGGAVA